MAFNFSLIVAAFVLRVLSDWIPLIKQRRNKTAKDEVCVSGAYVAVQHSILCVCVYVCGGGGGNGGGGVCCLYAHACVSECFECVRAR